MLKNIKLKYKILGSANGHFELPMTKVTGFGERRKAHTTFSCFTGYRLVFKETQV